MTLSGEEICQRLILKSKLHSLLLFIALALLLEFIVHYILKISVVYTHTFYLIIILAAIWYQRKAVFVAVFFSILHIIVSFLIQGELLPEPVFRAFMLCLIAYIVGSLVECMNTFRDEQIRQNYELIRLQEASLVANKKLNLLSSITRHDILNQLTVIMGYLDLLSDRENDPELAVIVQKQMDAAGTIKRQIEFTRNYQDIGVKSPIWCNIRSISDIISPNLDHTQISYSSDLKDLEIYVDPLFPLICENLIDNSLRHGEHVTEIRFKSEPTENGLVLIYEDDGVGIKDEEKEMIFNRGYGKHTGMGLFLTQEILAITGLSMQERGKFGFGVRFEINVPEGSFRFG